MKPKPLPVDELLRLACIYAERDQEEYARAIANGTDEASKEDQRKTAAFVAQLRAYQLKRWGQTKLEHALSKAKPVPITELAVRVETQEPWRSCDHEWGPQETFSEPNFGVPYASQRVCNKCRARRFENWCAARAGSVESILPPKE